MASIEAARLPHLALAAIVPPFINVTNVTAGKLP